MTKLRTLEIFLRIRVLRPADSGLFPGGWARRVVSHIGWTLLFEPTAQQIIWPSSRWARWKEYGVLVMVLPPIMAAAAVWFGPVGWVLRKTYLKQRVTRSAFLRQRAELYELGAPIIGTPFWDEPVGGSCYTTPEDWTAAQALAGVLDRGLDDEDVGYS